MPTIVIAILVLGILVMIHELGHFSIAKLAGIKIHEFAIGMGPKIFNFKKGETVYSLRALPLGGYVRMEGEDENSEDDRAFNNKPVFIRALVLAAGPLMNLIFGLLIFIIIYSLNPNVPQPIIDKLIEGMPAQEAELLPGDKIVKLNNSRIHIQEDIYFFLYQNKDKPVNVQVLRDNEKLNFKITPKYNKEQGRYMLGYSAVIKKMNVSDIIAQAYWHTAFYFKQAFISMGYLLTGKFSIDQFAGPVGIVNEIGTAAKHGFMNLLYFAAIISLSFAGFNLMPIPALDGGRLFFIIIEAIRRKPISPEKEGMIHFVGFVLLMLLVIVVSYNDIIRIAVPK